jgi:glutathione S-transferase
MLKLYYSPLSTYSQKTLMAFYEKGAAFEPVIVSLFEPGGRAEYLKVNPLGKLPFLEVSGAESWKVPESSIIIEYIDRHCPGGTKLIPDDPDLARQVRFRDRLNDLYITEPCGKIFFDTRRPEGQNDPYGVKEARERLASTLAILDGAMANNTWAMKDTFSMADCAAAAALNIANFFGALEPFKNVGAYYKRLCERPSYARVLKEAAPYYEKLMAGMKR